MNSSLPAYLAQEGWVIDLSVVGEEEGFAEDEGKTAISFEGEEDVFLAGCGKVRSSKMQRYSLLGSMRMLLLPR